MSSNLSNASEKSKTRQSANSAAKKSEKSQQKYSIAKNNLLNNDITQVLPPIKSTINDIVELNCADLVNLQTFSVKSKKNKAFGLPNIVFTPPKSQNSSIIINN